jgi:hypothetical protein
MVGRHSARAYKPTSPVRSSGGTVGAYFKVKQLFYYLL